MEKNIGPRTHDGTGRGHHRSSPCGPKWGSPSGEIGHLAAPVLLATRVSAQHRPCIYQISSPAETGESAVVPARLIALEDAYGRSGLIDVIVGDAGLCSRENAVFIERMGCTCVFGLKGNQKFLHDAAVLVLGEKTKISDPSAQSAWGSQHGCQERRQLWRSQEPSCLSNSIGFWDHLNEVCRSSMPPSLLREKSPPKTVIS